MKINVDIDCTPKEAREFLGLPDVAPIQDKFMKDLQARLEDNLQSMDSETLMKTFMPMMSEGLNQGLNQMGEIQKMFWNNLTSASQTSSSKNDE